MLDQIEHARIIADFERVCTTAGIQGRFLHESMMEHCGDAEADWVKKFWGYKAKGVPGLLLEGVKRPDTRCQAITAALIRNYIDARVIPLNTVIDLQSDHELPSPTVLLIPNLFIAATSKNIPAWKVQTVYDILLERSVKAKPTVVYVESMVGLKMVYGQPFEDFLNSYCRITA